jgi:hypothetical protein
MLCASRHAERRLATVCSGVSWWNFSGRWSIVISKS